MPMMYSTLHKKYFLAADGETIRVGEIAPGQRVRVGQGTLEGSATEEGILAAAASYAESDIGYLKVLANRAHWFPGPTQIDADSPEDQAEAIRSEIATGRVLFPKSQGVWWSGRIHNPGADMVGVGETWECVLRPIHQDSTFFLHGEGHLVADISFMSDLVVYNRSYGMLNHDSAHGLRDANFYRVGYDAPLDGRNLVFFKSYADAQVKNIVFDGIDVRASGRMGIEIFHEAADTIVTRNSSFKHVGGSIHGMGVSYSQIAGGTNFQAYNNYYEDCPYTAIELAGRFDGVHIHHETFGPLCNRSVKSSSDNTAGQLGCVIHDCEDTDDAGGEEHWDLYATHGAKIYNNKIKRPVLYRCHNSEFWGNEVRSRGRYALFFEHATGNVLRDNLLSNVESVRPGGGFSVCRFDGPGAHSNTITGGQILKTVGVFYDELNGANNNTVEVG